MDTHANAAPAAEPLSIAGADTSESPALNELAAALAKAQGAFSNPAKDRENPHFRSRYATLDAVIEATRGPLADNGLSLTQTIGGGRAPLLRTRLLHSSGQWLASEVALFASGKGSQVFGSELTYMRRYALCALLNIAPAEGDDDGNAAQAASAAASTAQAPRDGQRPGNGAGQAKRPEAAGGQQPRAAAKEPARRSGPAGDARQEPSAPPDQHTAPQKATATQRRKNETTPPLAWGILRPGKARITASDGAAWLNWWETLAGRAAAEGKLDGLRALYEANAATWGEIDRGSAEAHDVVARATQTVQAALGT